MTRPQPHARRLPALFALLVCAALLGACSLLPPTDERDAISGADANQSLPANAVRQPSATVPTIPKAADPAEVARSFVQAYSTFDTATLATISCAPRQPQILAQLQKFRAAGNDVKIDVSQLQYTQENANDRTALVGVDGSVKISGGGKQQEGPVGILLGENENDALYLVQDLTGWKVCTTR